MVYAALLDLELMLELEKVRKMEKLNESVPRASAGVTNEKLYEKYAWILLFTIGVIMLVGGVPHSLGINTDPETVERIIGMTLNEFQDSNPGFFDLYMFYFRFGGLILY